MKRRFELIVKEELDELNRDKLDEGLGNLAANAFGYVMNRGGVNVPSYLKTFYNTNISNAGQTKEDKIADKLRAGDISDFTRYINTDLYLTIINWDRNHSDLKEYADGTGARWRSYQAANGSKPLELIAKTDDGVNYLNNFSNQNGFILKCIDRLDGKCISMTVSSPASMAGRISSTMMGGVNGTNAIRDIDAKGVQYFLMDFLQNAKKTSTVPPPLPVTSPTSPTMPPPLPTATPVSTAGESMNIETNENENVINEAGIFSKIGFSNVFAVYVDNPNISSAIQNHDRDLYTRNISGILQGTKMIDMFAEAIDDVLNRIGIAAKDGESVTKPSSDGSGGTTPPAASAASAPAIGTLSSSGTGSPTSIGDYAAAAATPTTNPNEDIASAIDSAISSTRGNTVRNVYLTKIKQICRDKNDLIKLKNNLKNITSASNVNDLVGNNVGADMLAKVCGIPEPPVHSVSTIAVENIIRKAPGLIREDTAYIPKKYLPYLPATEGSQLKGQVAMDKSFGSDVKGVFRGLGRAIRNMGNSTDIGTYTN